MYRNITYKTNDSGQGVITLYTWDKDGNPIENDFVHESYVIYSVPYETELKSIKGENLKIRTFRNSWDRSRFLDNTRGLNIIEALTPEREFLRKAFLSTYEDEDFSKFNLRKFFTDIEISVENEFPDPMYAKYPINVITIFDSKTEKYYTWALGKYENHDTSKIVSHTFNNENELLLSFLEFWKLNYPDIITGWNTMGFDIPYIINRLTKVFDKSIANQLSPVNKCSIREMFDGLTGQRILKCRISGISHLDYLMLIRDKYSPQNYKNHKLNTVAEEELHIGKLEHDESFQDFWKNNFQKFVEYNIRDVELVVKLDNHFNYIELSRKTCNLSLCEYESIQYSIPNLIGAISAYSLKHHDKYFNTHRAEIFTTEGYEGAYVKPPRKGIYYGGVVGIDLNSLYPNTMIALNLSIETKFGKLHENDINDNSDYYIDTVNGKRIYLSTAELNKLLDTKFTKSANNILFLKPTLHKGVIPEFLEIMYSERVKEKQTLLQTKKRLSKAIDANDTILAEECKRIIKQKNALQNSYKIFLNSMYGIFGNQYCPIFDVDLAEAITLTAQFITRSSFAFLNSYMHKKYDISDSEYEAAIYSDTDSIYIDFEPILKEYHDISKNKISKPTLKKLCKAAEDLTDLINKFCEKHVNKHCYTSLGNRIEFKFENFSHEALFIAKKRYVLHVLVDDGAFIDKYKYTGVEVKQQSFPDQYVKFLKDIYDKILHHRYTYSDFRTLILDFWEKFKLMDYDQLASYKKYNTAKESVGFLALEKGAQAHHRAAEFYNHLIKELNISDKYELINPGDRIRYIYINKSNEYNIDVIGYLDNIPKEFTKLFNPDYRRIFNTSLYKPLYNITENLNWPTFSLDMLDTEFDIFSL